MILPEKLLDWTNAPRKTGGGRRAIIETLENRALLSGVLSTAVPLGTLQGRVTVADSVNAKSNPADYFSLSLASPGILNISLSLLSANADVVLIQDTNHNGVADAGETIARSAHAGKVDETINATLSAGAYVVGVIAGTSASTSYRLILTPDYAGNSTAAARNIGTLAGTANFSDFVGNIDTNDYYSITLASAQMLTAGASGLSSAVGIQIIGQTTGAGGAKINKVWATTTAKAAGGSIQQTLSAGAYFVRIFEAASATNYTLSLAMSPAAVASGLHIVFDYRYDAGGFFTANPQAKAILDLAATAFSQYTDHLSAIAPSAGNSWSATFSDPTSGVMRAIANPTVAANTLLIYVGGSSQLQSLELGEGAPGGYNATGSLDWLNTVVARGQLHALDPRPTDFGPWGGTISFSSAAHWNFSTQPPAANENDFLSVATHEIAHVLGIGTSDSWFAQCVQTQFDGPHAMQVFGGPVQLAAADQHWADGIVSSVNGVPQAAEMDPFLPVGQRRQMTALDYAGLADVGWGAG